MYTILGTDGKEYGPVTADKIREWITAGRANAQTKIRKAGDAEWTAIGALPEFGAAAAVPPVAASALSPATVPVAAAPSVAASTLTMPAVPLAITGCIRKGMATGAANFWPLLGVSLLVGLCAGLLGAIPLLGILCNLFLTGVFYGGLYYYVVKKVRGEQTEVGDAFSGFSVCFGQLALATIVCTLLTVIAFVCLIIPGIYLVVCWAFTYVLVRDKGLGFWDAMEHGRQVITRQWFRLFGLFLLVGLGLLALLAIPIGMIIAGAVTLKQGGTPAAFALIGCGGFAALVICLGASPFLQSILMHAYEELFSQPAGKAV